MKNMRKSKMKENVKFSKKSVNINIYFFNY